MIKLFLTLLLAFFCFNSFGQQFSEAYEEAIKLYESDEYNASIEKSLSIIKHAEKENNTKWIARANLLISESCYKLKQYNNAITHLSQFHKLNTEKGLKAYGEALQGDVHKKNKNPTLAIDCYKKAYTTYLALESNKSLVQMTIEIASLYNYKKNYKEATDWIKQGLAISKRNNLSKLTLSLLILQGQFHSNYGDDSSSLAVFEEALSLSKKLKAKHQEKEIESFIKIVKQNAENKKKQETNFSIAKEKIKSEEIDSLAFVNAKSIKDIEKLSEAVQLVEYKLKAQADDYKKRILTEQLDKLEKEKKLDKAKAKLLINQSLLENERIRNEQQNTKIFGLILSMVFTITILALVYLAYIKKKKNNLVLLDKNKIILNQKTKIETKSNQINASIAYAKQIQSSTLPSFESFKHEYKNSFILFRPKDNVSGDFFWHYSTKNYFYAAVVDCTGHGIPGAFMSLICNNIIEKVSLENEFLTPKEILKKSDFYLSENFKKYNTKDNHVKDGMDISLIRIDKTTKELVFSGARNSIYIVREGKLMELKANQRSIGLFNYFDLDEFEDSKLQLYQEDLIYLFSDGFTDQKGGERNKKYYTKPFKKLLTEVSKQNLEEQKTIINKTFDDWKSGNEQVDDVTIIGLRV